MREVVRLSGDIATDGQQAAVPQDAQALDSLLREFFLWEPIVPTDHKGKIDLKGFAMLLAPLCRMLRDDVADALKDTNSPLVQLAQDWRKLLFPGAPDEQFADAYAQTVTFALLLGRSEGADPLTLESARASLVAQHSLLARALQVLTDTNALIEIAASLNLLLRVIAVVPPAMLRNPRNPWLYFYEDFRLFVDLSTRICAEDPAAYAGPALGGACSAAGSSARSHVHRTIRCHLLLMCKQQGRTGGIAAELYVDSGVGGVPGRDDRE